VFGGMLISTVLNLAITPVLYIIIKSLAGHRRRPTNGSIHGLIKEETPTATVPSNV
jgi:hypothetical protein